MGHCLYLTHTLKMNAWIRDDLGYILGYRWGISQSAVADDFNMVRFWKLYFLVDNSHAGHPFAPASGHSDENQLRAVYEHGHPQSVERS